MHERVTFVEPAEISRAEYEHSDRALLYKIGIENEECGIASTALRAGLSLPVFYEYILLHAPHFRLITPSILQVLVQGPLKRVVDLVPGIRVRPTDLCITHALIITTISLSQPD